MRYVFKDVGAKDNVTRFVGEFYLVSVASYAEFRILGQFMIQYVPASLFPDWACTYIEFNSHGTYLSFNFNNYPQIYLMDSRNRDLACTRLVCQGLCYSGIVNDHPKPGQKPPDRLHGGYCVDDEGMSLCAHRPRLIFKYACVGIGPSVGVA